MAVIVVFPLDGRYIEIIKPFMSNSLNLYIILASLRLFNYQAFRLVHTLVTDKGDIRKAYFLHMIVTIMNT